MASPFDSIRESVPWMKDFSDEEVLKKASEITGMGVQDVAEYFGAPTGRGRNALSAGLRSGWEDIKGLGYSAAGAGADVVGAKGTRDWFNKQADKRQTASELESRPDLENIEGVWDQPSKWAPYGVYQIGKQVPNLAAGIGMGLAVPEVAVPAALSRAATLGPRVLGMGGAKAGMTWAEREAAVKAGQTFGKQVVGGGAFNEAQSVGSLYQEAVDAGRPDASGEVFAKSIPYALSETLPESMLAGRFLHGSGIKGNIAKRMGISGAIQGASGATSEALQNELEISMHPEGQLTPEQIASRRLNSPVAGGLVEGVLGSFGGIRGHRAPLDTKAPADLTKRLPDNDYAEQFGSHFAPEGLGLRTPEEHAAYTQQQAEDDLMARLNPGAAPAAPVYGTDAVGEMERAAGVAPGTFAPVPAATPAPAAVKPKTTANAVRDATTAAAAPVDPVVAQIMDTKVQLRDPYVESHLPADHEKTDGQIYAAISRLVGSAKTMDEAAATLRDKIVATLAPAQGKGSRAERDERAGKMIQFYDNIVGTPDAERLTVDQWRDNLKAASVAAAAATAKASAKVGQEGQIPGAVTTVDPATLNAAPTPTATPITPATAVPTPTAAVETPPAAPATSTAPGVPAKPTNPADLPAYQAAITPHLLAGVLPGELQALQLVHRVNAENAGDEEAAVASLRAAAKESGIPHTTLADRANRGLAKIEANAAKVDLPVEAAQALLGMQTSLDVADVAAAQPTGYEGQARVITAPSEEHEPEAGYERGETAAQEGEVIPDETDTEGQGEEVAVEGAQPAEGASQWVDHRGQSIAHADVQDAEEEYEAGRADDEPTWDRLSPRLQLTWVRGYIAAYDLFPKAKEGPQQQQYLGRVRKGVQEAYKEQPNEADTRTAGADEGADANRQAEKGPDVAGAAEGIGPEVGGVSGTDEKADTGRVSPAATEGEKPADAEKTGGGTETTPPVVEKKKRTRKAAPTPSTTPEEKQALETSKERAQRKWNEAAGHVADLGTWDKQTPELQDAFAKFDEKDQKLADALKLKNAFPAVAAAEAEVTKKAAEAKAEKAAAAKVEEAAPAAVPAPTQEQLDTGVGKLTGDEQQELADHYGTKVGSKKFFTKLAADVAKYTNQGAQAVAAAIRNIVAKVAAGVLSIGIVFNPMVFHQNEAHAFAYDLPAAITTSVTTTKDIRATVPAEAAAKMSDRAQRVYEAMAPQAKESGKGFLIADKPMGFLHAFHADGSVIAQASSLYGMDVGDVERGNSLTGGAKITPAGQFTLVAQPYPEYTGGMVFMLKETNKGGGFIAIHAVYLGEPKEQRAQRLASPSPEDNRISYGCINTTNETFLNDLLPNSAELTGGPIFVLPDDTSKTEAMFPAKTETTTATTTSQPGNIEADKTTDTERNQPGLPEKTRAVQRVAAKRRREKLKTLLDSGDYVFHAVRNDDAIAGIFEHGLKYGSNLSFDRNGQAFEGEGDTILVFRKEDVGARNKGYQNDGTVTKVGAKPVAIIKDTSLETRAEVTDKGLDAESERLVDAIEANNKLADGLWRGAGLEKEDRHDNAGQTLQMAFYRASLRKGEERAAADRELRKQLGDFYDRAKEVARESDRLDKQLDDLNDKLERGATTAVTPESVLARYEQHGVPAYDMPAPSDEGIQASTARRVREETYTTYDVIDTQTGQAVRSYTNKNRARNMREKLDLEYGAVRYRVQERVVEANTRASAGAQPKRLTSQQLKARVQELHDRANDLQRQAGEHFQKKEYDEGHALNDQGTALHKVANRLKAQIEPQQEIETLLARDNLSDEKRALADRLQEQVDESVAEAEGKLQPPQASRSPRKSRTTVARIRDVLEPLFFSGRRFDRRVTIVQSVDELPWHKQKFVSEGYGAEAMAFVTRDGHVYLIADRISKGDELAVFLHEIGVHTGMERLIGGGNMHDLASQISRWSELNDDSAESTVAREAMDRVKYAMEAAEKAGTPLDEFSKVHETIAYFVEEAVYHGINPTAMDSKTALGRWFRQFWKAVVERLRRLGIDHPNALSAQDIVDLAHGAAQLDLKNVKEREGFADQAFAADFFDGKDLSLDRMRFSLARTATPGAMQKFAADKHLNKVHEFAKKHGLGFMITEDIADLAAANGLGEVRDYVEATKQREGARREFEAPVAKIAELYDHLPERERGTGAGSVNKFLHDATTTGSTTGINALSATGQQLVKAVFQHGKDVLALKKKLIEDEVGGEYSKRIAQETDAAKKAELVKERDLVLRKFSKLWTKGPSDTYAPLKRFGDYVVSAKSKEYVQHEEGKTDADRKWISANESDPAHVQMHFADTMAEAEALEAEIKQQYDFKGGKTYAAAREADIHNSRDLFRAFPVLQTRLEAEYPMLDGKPSPMARLMRDMYLEALAENTARKNELRRRNITGASVDMVRAFVTQGRADAHFLANLKHNDAVTKAVQAMRKGADRDRRTLTPYLNEMLKRHDASYENHSNAVANRFKRVTSIWMLATNPSYYLQQVAQPWVMSLPVIAGRHGYFRTARALREGYAALESVLKGTGLTGHIDWSQAPADVRDMLNAVSRNGAIDVTNSMDMGEWKLVDKGKAGAAWNRVDQKLRGLNTRVEAINRASTAIASYRLELARNGGDKVAATQYAEAMVRQTHGSYDGSNTPRYMQGSAAQVVSQFRRFQIIQLSLIARLYHNAFRNSDPVEKGIARRALTYTLMHTFAVGGALGLPGAAVLASLVARLFGPSDEPPDFEKLAREAIGDQVISDLLLKGVPAMLGVDLSSKLGMGQILSVAPFADFPYDRKSFEKYAFAALGPVFGLGAKAVDGLAQLYAGNLEKGAELLLPTGLGNVMKGYRYGTEGVSLRKGDTVLSKDDISFADALLQGLGLPTTTITHQQRLSQTKYEFDTYYHDRTAALIQDYQQARKNGESVADVMQEWRDVQDARVRNGYARQPVSTLIKSAQQQRKSERNTAGGVEFVKANKKFVQEQANL